MNNKYILGIDIGGTNIKYIIINESGKEMDHFENKTEAFQGRKQILKNLLEGILYICNNNKNIKLYGIGVGSPGLISKEGKVITGAAKLKGWNGTNIKKIIEKKINLQVFVDNDVTLVALGEAYFGAGKKYDKVLCIALGTGLGGGIIINKHIYRGKHGYAGEFGHIVVNPDGAECTCGKKGCLETYASTIGLKRMAKELLIKNQKSKIFNYVKNINDVMPIHIFQAFKEKDPIAAEILNKMSYYLGYGISHLVNIFDPDIMILAGGISKAGKPLLNLIYKHLYDFTLPFYNNKINIQFSKFKDKSGVIGAASLIFEKMEIPTL